MNDHVEEFLSRQIVWNWLWRLSLVNAPPGVRVRVHYPLPYWRLQPLGVWIGFN